MLRNAAKPAGIVLLVVVVFMALGFRINHPHYGVGSALGSAKSSLAIYKRGGNPTVGQKVLITVPNWPAASPALGIVRTVQGDKILVILGNDIRQVTKKEIGGHLLAVVPFFGYLFGAVGL
jgi:hypothetical protein